MAVNRIRFFDGLSDYKRRDLTGRHWVYQNPQRQRRIGLNMVEANVLRTLCVAYDVARLLDSVRNDEPGLLVPNEYVEVFAKAIINVVE